MTDEEYFKTSSRDPTKTVGKNAKGMSEDDEFNEIGNKFILRSYDHYYTYNFTWMGRPIIQYPTDLIALQEIIFSTKPDVIIETGVALGGSLIFYSSMLKLLNNDGKVIGIDIFIKDENRKAIEEHLMSEDISLIVGSSTSDDTLSKIKELIPEGKKVMVVLDSNHAHQHVLNEMRLYSPLVTKGNYLVVFDSIVEDLPRGFVKDRPWDKGNNPKTAIWEFLKNSDRFEIDKIYDQKLIISTAPNGYLICKKD